MGAAAARASRRGSRGVRAGAHARQARNGPVGSRPRGAVARDDDGRRTRGDGRRGFGARCALDRRRRARASACSSRRPIPSAAPASSSSTRRMKGLARPTTRGRRRRRNGASSSRPCGQAGASAATSRVSLDEWAPEVAEDERFRDWFVWHMRRSLSPGAALTSFRTAMELDVGDVLAAVRVPTLVIPRPALPGPGHYTAERIRGRGGRRACRNCGVSTRGSTTTAHRATMEATERFVSRLTERVESERVLATILFTDIVGSTELAARLGDAAWRELLQRHHAHRPPRARAVPGPGARHGRRRVLRRLRWARPCRPRRGCDPRLARRARDRDPRRSAYRRVRGRATARSPASRSRSGHASQRSPNRARCSSRARSRISSQARTFGSRIAASTS